MSPDCRAGLDIGKRYRIKLIDHEYPVLEKDGHGDVRDTGRTTLVEGREYDAVVVDKPASRPDFVEVLNLRRNKRHLIHVPGIATLECLGDGSSFLQKGGAVRA